MDYLQKPVTCSKSLVYPSEEIFMSMDMSAPSERQALVTVYKHDSQNAEPCCQYNSVL